MIPHGCCFMISFSGAAAFWLGSCWPSPQPRWGLWLCCLYLFVLSVLGLSSSKSLALQKDVSGLKAQQPHTSLVIIILQCLRQNQRSKHWKALAWETIQKARKRVADGPPRELLRRRTILICQRRIWIEFEVLDPELSNARCRHQINGVSKQIKGTSKR